jgi:repressor LexA
MNDQLPSKKQRELLNFIDGFIRGNGYGPSYREIMRALDYKSVSTVAVHVDGLIARGYLNKRDRSARSLEVANAESSGKGVEKSGVSVREKWLVDVVSAKIDRLVENASPRAVHDVNILVETLGILGFESAQTSLQARLQDITKHLDQTRQ